MDEVTCSSRSLSSKSLYYLNKKIYIFFLLIPDLSNHVVVQSLNHVRLFTTPWTAASQTSLSSISQSLLKLMSSELVMPSKHLILCCLLLLLPSIFPSIRVFSNELVLHIKWPKYWSFSFSISPSNDYSGLISLRIDWFELLAVQGTLKSLLNKHPWFYHLLTEWHDKFLKLLKPVLCL